MTEEQITEVERLRKAAPEKMMYVTVGGWFDILGRLLEERKRLLQALNGVDTACEPTDVAGTHRGTDGNGGWSPDECPMCEASAALAFAEGPAP